MQLPEFCELYYSTKNIEQNKNLLELTGECGDFKNIKKEIVDIIQYKTLKVNIEHNIKKIDNFKIF